ncbi:MAG: hypothetical protein KDB80_00430, partial [Planctomycetes bacterium]|nr:hypothetical protein [Planctomycetota bacterium]
MANDRIDLKRLSPRDWLALFESTAAFEESFGLPAAEGLRELLVVDDVSDDWLEALRSSARPDPWTHGFAIVLRETREVIGTFGFKGPP